MTKNKTKQKHSNPKTAPCFTRFFPIGKKEKKEKKKRKKKKEQEKEEEKKSKKNKNNNKKNITHTHTNTSMFAVAHTRCILATKFARSFFLMMYITVY